MEVPDVQVMVEIVANKQQQNKRKRDPDLYLDAVLECTVRKLNRERMERDEAQRKRRRTDSTERTSYSTISDASLNSGNNSLDSARTLNKESVLSSHNKTDCEIDTDFLSLEDELSSDLKDLLDELSREVPCDFWLTDTNNNNNGVEAKENDGDIWLSSFIEVLG